MGRNNSHDKLPNKVGILPQVFIDKESDFAAIKIAKGIEHKSYEQDGFIFCEDKAGRIIEIQFLNLSKLRALSKKVTGSVNRTKLPQSLRLDSLGQSDETGSVNRTKFCTSNGMPIMV